MAVVNVDSDLGIVGSTKFEICRSRTNKHNAITFGSSVLGVHNTKTLRIEGYWLLDSNATFVRLVEGHTDALDLTSVIDQISNSHTRSGKDLDRGVIRTAHLGVNIMGGVAFLLKHGHGNLEFVLRISQILLNAFADVDGSVFTNGLFEIIGDNGRRIGSSTTRRIEKGSNRGFVHTHDLADLGVGISLLLELIGAMLTLGKLLVIGNGPTSTKLRCRDPHGIGDLFLGETRILEI